MLGAGVTVDGPCGCVELHPAAASAKNSAVITAGQRLTMNREMPAARSAERSRPLCAVNEAIQAIETAAGSSRREAAAPSPSKARPPVSQPIRMTTGCMKRTGR